MAFFQALSGIFSIIIIVGIGYLLAKRSWVNEEISAFIPRLVNYIALPTFMLWNLTHNFDARSLKGLFYGLAVPFSSMFICCILALIFSKVLKVAPHRRGVFRTVFFCSNTVFIGIPVNLALFGEVSTPYVLLYFLVNTFFFWTVGNYFIGKDKKGAQSKLFSIDNMKKIFSPPF